MRHLIRGTALLTATLLLAAAGPAPSDPSPVSFSGSLRDGYYRVHSVTLRAGYDYTLVGACDDDCDDLDLQLFDEDGNLIDEDLLSDDIPEVSVSPRWTGVFHVKVIMESCYIEPCRYAVAS
jgi:hypothetical protein